MFPVDHGPVSGPETKNPEGFEALRGLRKSFDFEN
jgi:hypothetical protein